MNGYVATLRSAIAEASSNRRALIFQMGVMIVNDVAWIGFWVLFFGKAGTVHGWDTSRIVLLQSVLTTAGGLTLGVLSNARHLSALALDGRLDAVLSLPVHPLGHLLVRRLEPTNLGDVVFGVVLFAVAGHPTPGRTVVFVGVSLASVVLLTSFLVLTGSLSFFAGRSDGGELGFNAILLLGNYPLDLFGGAARVMLYTVIPAAFVATVPAQLIIRFDAGRAAILGGVTATFAIAALTVFNAGLRRYASGSTWTRA